ncbi:MAG: DoxX family protein [Dysgonamonadaceae bacterium]|jgi:uncharacterized membrane protein YphA (DoxX/SURF4 family)|nr:DoxX family protein [Dysgonamonadaceae bacterium]
MKLRFKKSIVEISRIVLGAVFVFSGFVKAVDPWGTIYKIEDHLEAFGLDLWSFIALPFAFGLFVIEFGIGICLLLGVYRKLNTIFALLFLAVMTPLTLYLAIKNPITDCGCFGDALTLSNRQTFFKNLPLLLMAIYLFLHYKLIMSAFTKRCYSLIAFWAYAFIAGVALYSFSCLPILDFRPYKTGANIPALMEIPEDAEQPVFDTKLIYSKDGIQREFTIADYPKGDSSWVFVTSKTVTVKKGYEPPIHDFSITTEEGDDITGNVLSDPNYTFLLIAHKLGEASDNNVYKINNIYDYSQKFGYKFYALTASNPAEIREWVKNTGAEYPFCTMDDITLKTIVRSNPGLLLLKNGTIINKWSNRTLPNLSKLNMPLDNGNIGKIPAKHNERNMIIATLIFIIPLSILFLLDFFVYGKQQRERGEKRLAQNK